MGKDREQAKYIMSSFRSVDAVARSALKYSSNGIRSVKVIDMCKREMMREHTTLAIQTDHKV